MLFDDLLDIVEDLPSNSKPTNNRHSNSAPVTPQLHAATNPHAALTHSTNSSHNVIGNDFVIVLKDIESSKNHPNTINKDLEVPYK